MFKEVLRAEKSVVRWKKKERTWDGKLILYFNTCNNEKWTKKKASRKMEMINVIRETSETLHRKSTEKNQGDQKVFIFIEQHIGRSFSYTDQFQKGEDCF